VHVEVGELTRVRVPIPVVLSAIQRGEKDDRISREQMVSFVEGLRVP
jgi:hypothetical protein